MEMAIIWYLGMGLLGAAFALKERAPYCVPLWLAMACGGHLFVLLIRFFGGQP